MKELQNARIDQAGEAIRAAEADITAAGAGIEAARSVVLAAQGGIDATKADVQRTALERRRHEALIATESATRQKIQQVVADAEKVAQARAGVKTAQTAYIPDITAYARDTTRTAYHSWSTTSASSECI